MIQRVTLLMVIRQQISLSKIVVTSAMNQLINNEIYTLKTGSTSHDLEIQCDGNTAPSIKVLASEFDANNFTLNKGTAENIGFAIFPR